MILLLVSTSAVPLRAGADPIVGFIEEWSGSVLSGWDNGGATYGNPGSGGFLGTSGDGYLEMSTTTVANLGAVCQSCAQYTGNWQSAGVKSVEVWLNDIGADDPLEIHFSLAEGQRINVWQYNVGFQPPLHTWAKFVVDLTSASNFTRIRGSGTFDHLLQNVGYVHFRHDVAPYIGAPNAIAADVGIDHLVLSDVNVPVLPSTWGRIKAIYR